MPLIGTEPKTLQAAGRCSNHWACGQGYILGLDAHGWRGLQRAEDGASGGDCSGKEAGASPVPTDMVQGVTGAPFLERCSPGGGGNLWNLEQVVVSHPDRQLASQRAATGNQGRESKAAHRLL